MNVFSPQQTSLDTAREPGLTLSAATSIEGEYTTLKQSKDDRCLYTTASVGTSKASLQHEQVAQHAKGQYACLNNSGEASDYTSLTAADQDMLSFAGVSDKSAHLKCQDFKKTVPTYASPLESKEGAQNATISHPECVEKKDVGVYKLPAAYAVKPPTVVPTSVDVHEGNVSFASVVLGRRLVAFIALAFVLCLLISISAGILAGIALKKSGSSTSTDRDSPGQEYVSSFVPTSPTEGKRRSIAIAQSYMIRIFTLCKESGPFWLIREGCVLFKHDVSHDSSSYAFPVYNQ